ncbi:MAG TPA: hypothetical protein VIP77_20405 [Jiangellaceae bacterium]
MIRLGLRRLSWTRYSVAALFAAFALTACAGSDDADPEARPGTTASDARGASDATETPADGGTTPVPTGTEPAVADAALTIPEQCSDDVMAMLETFADGNPVSNLGPDELDPDLVCTFLGGEDGLANALGVIVSTDEPIDWSQLGEVTPSEVIVGEFTGELATLTGAGRALVVDLGGVHVTVNAGRDSVATDADLAALADLMVRAVAGG